MRQALILWSLLALPSMAFGAIPRTQFILQKAAAQGGSGSYVVEQDVTFTSANDRLTLRESWIVESENSYRVTVTGPKELSTPLNLQIAYTGGQRIQIVEGSKRAGRWNEDFLDKYFFARNRDTLHRYLTQDKILPAQLPAAKTFRTSKEFSYIPEPFARLTRVGGALGYQLGPAPRSDKDTQPAAWFEQDFFNLRRLRLASGVEVRADSYGSYLRGWALPKSRRIQWGQNVAQVTLVRVSNYKPSKPVVLANVEVPSSLGGIADPGILAQIQEFYSRLR